MHETNRRSFLAMGKNWRNWKFRVKEERASKRQGVKAAWLKRSIVFDASHVVLDAFRRFFGQKNTAVFMWKWNHQQQTFVTQGNIYACNRFLNCKFELNQGYLTREVRSHRLLTMTKNWLKLHWLKTVAFSKHRTLSKWKSQFPHLLITMCNSHIIRFVIKWEQKRLKPRFPICLSSFRGHEKSL